MKTSTMTKAAYHEEHGPLGLGRTSEETLALWDKIKKLPINEYLIVEPGQRPGRWQVSLIAVHVG